MAKIALVTSQSLRLCPYIETYTSVLEEYDLIYWDRCGFRDEDVGADNTFRYDGVLKVGYGKGAALHGYFGFMRYVNRIVAENRYDKLVVMQVPTAILLYTRLVSRYKDAYVLDIRDYSYERYALYRHFEKVLISKSALSVVSSEGFKRFLPKGNYCVSHNISETMPLTKANHFTYDKPIVISYIGWINYYEQNVKLIDLFSNDERFVLQFIGEGSDSLRAYLDKKGSSNIALRGSYAPAEIEQLYEEADVIANVYGSNDPLLDYALSNKLYYCAAYRKSILVSPGTYMASLSKELGIGFTVDFDDGECKEKLIQFLSERDDRVVDGACREFLEKVQADNSILKDNIKTFTEEAR